MDNLLEKDLTASEFDDQVKTRALPARAQTVVVGAGVVGSSIAYHLAELGHKDVLLIERASVASGTSWHAAGLVVRSRATHAMTKLSYYGIDAYRAIEKETGINVSLQQNGSLSLARTPGRLDELRYSDMVARHNGIATELVSPQRVAELHPLATSEGLLGGMHHAEDGHVNPGRAALAFAKGAHTRGVTIREGVTVTGVQKVNGRITAVETDLGVVECENLVLAAGLWTRELAEICGAMVPLHPAAHVHVTTDPIEGADVPLPVLRDLDGYLYVRGHNGSLVVGAFEPDGIPVDPRSLAKDFAFGEFDPDWEHFAAIKGFAEDRIPALKTANYSRFLNAPESFTPDASFCLGETAEVDGLWIAAGFNSQGIIYAPGAGRALAEWIVAGTPTTDVSAVDVQRFSKYQSNRPYLFERTKEGLGRLYAMHWPFLQPYTARNIRRSPLHERLDSAGAVFGELVGYERANWFAPAGVKREYEYSYQRQNWFEHSAAEHTAAREAVAVFDLSTFTKVEVAGPDALKVVQSVTTSNLDVKIGRVVYTLMLNKGGGIELDGTITRLAEDRFMVVTPTASQTKTLAMFRRAARGHGAAVFDASAGLATIGIMGPNSRELLSRISPADFSTENQPWGTAREIEVGNGSALCLRVSFVGELGYELYPTNDIAVSIYDSVIEAGEDLGLRRAGYHALDSLRVEKGYRHLGHDIGPIDDPYQASLGFAVNLKKGDFVGRSAIEGKQNPDRRQVYIKLDNPEPLFVHDESILLDGKIIGHVTSGSYGHTIGGACGLGNIPADVPAGSNFVVDCAGVLIPATISDVPFYDPENLRLKA